MNPLIQKVQEIGSIRNIPQFLFISIIDFDSTLAVRKEIIKFKSKHEHVNEIDFIIDSPGGIADDAYRIIRTFRKNFEKVNVIVPFWAKSAATLLSLGGSTIIMDEFGEFGPLDLQLPKQRDDGPDFDRESALIDGYSLRKIEMHAREMIESVFFQLYTSQNVPIHKNELLKQLLTFTSTLYQPLLAQIDPYKLGEKYRKLEIGQEYAEKILKLFHPDLSKERKYQFIDYLLNDCPDHGFIIDFDLIEGFFPEKVKTSESISKEYKNLISELSTLLMEPGNSDTKFIGFIEVPNENKVSKIDEGLIDGELDKHNGVPYDELNITSSIPQN